MISERKGEDETVNNKGVTKTIYGMKTIAEK